ncbi:EamA family transporter RarD [Spongiactinospora sp. TRM90649]|uniref:EamA family transporter RarD n=1 Tax=Spongiactinospora sp. TRM90649 TaxID=3031114 RepID=UPI0023F7946B|nr:EamA family transporter RarD [Spongiactinospora sp. TRM90649]MDF5751050.1 EamA family transporter RarD [Spongiactinospora sp. TRM90649]
MSEARRGLLLGGSAYALWGLSALYWPLVEPTGPVEIMALRALWSLVAIMVLVSAMGRWRRAWRLARGARTLALLAAAGTLTAVNWAMFIYAVMNGQVVEASLGYFITPLVSVAFGVIVFRERLRRWQWAAIALGAATVLILSVDYGRPPWIALGLAVTFGTYGLIKKHLNAGAAESLLVETAILFPFALVYTLVLQFTGNATFGHVSAANTALGIGSGLVMLLPVLLFSAAATRVPLTTIGLLQYIEPAVQFLIGLLVFHEEMPGPRWAGFALLWAALAVLAVDGLRARRRASTSAVAGTAEGYDLRAPSP